MRILAVADAWRDHVEAGEEAADLGPRPRGDGDGGGLVVAAGHFGGGFGGQVAGGGGEDRFGIAEVGVEVIGLALRQAGRGGGRGLRGQKYRVR
ncbi:MAG: hypothetical protein ACRDOE_26100 [Streptosporangiaceae bacterium]